MSNANDFVIENGVLVKYVGAGGDVVIPEGVTEIGNEAFYWCSGLETVVVPEGVTVIEKKAFFNCGSLKKVNLPESLVKIDDNAFGACVSLSEINVPTNLSELGQNVFVDIATPMLIIHNQLHCCASDEDVVIPDGVEVIRSGAFWERKLKKLIIPDSVTDIKPNAIYCDYSEFAIECSNEKWGMLWESIKQFGTKEKAEFCLCYIRSNAVFGDERQDIINYISREKDKILNLIAAANDASSLAKLLDIVKTPTLDALEKYIKKYSGSAELVAILLQYREKNYSDAEVEKKHTDKEEKELGIKARTVSDWKEIFTFKVTDGSVTINSYKGDDADVVIPDFIGKNPVTAIGNRAFSKENSTYKDDRKKFFSAKLKTVVLPHTVTSVGESAFERCENLRDIKLPAKLRKIENDAFYECKNLTRIDLPNTVSSIGKSAFLGCESLLSIELPSKIKKIQDYTFFGCKKLESVRMSDSVKTIGDSAFGYCEKLKEFKLPEKIEKIGRKAFSGCKTLADERGFVIVNDVLYNYYGTDIDIMIPQGIVAVASRAFARNKTVKSVVIPEGVTSLGEGAFDECTELGRVTIPDSLDVAEFRAFADCPKLQLTLPIGKKSIREWDGSLKFVAE